MLKFALHALHSFFCFQFVGSFFSLSVYHFLLPVFPAIQVAVPFLSLIYLARAFMFLGVPAAISPPFSPLLNLNQLFSFGPFFFYISARMSAEVFHSTSSVFIEVELQMQTTLPTFLGGGKILKHSRGKKGGPNKWLSKMLPNQARANF